MAAYPRYTKTQLKELLKIFTNEQQDFLSAYYGNENESTLTIARQKLNKIIEIIEEALQEKNISADMSEQIDDHISSFVDESPIVKSSFISTENQSQAYSQAAENLIQFSTPLVSDVMRFSKKFSTTDPAHSILKPIEAKINAYNILLNHKKEGTLKLASKDEVQLIANIFSENGETQKQCIDRLAKVPLSQTVNEYDNYLKNIVLKDKNVLTVAKMQHLENAGHHLKNHATNIGLVVGGGLLGLGATLTGAPLVNTSLQVILQYIGQVGALTSGILVGITALTVSSRSIINSIRGKILRKKMSSISLEKMAKVFELVQQNQPSKDKTNKKTKKQCIATINKELKKAGINIKLDNLTYSFLSDTEKTINKYPLKVSKASIKSDKSMKKRMKKTTKVATIANKELADDILTPIFGDIAKLNTSPRSAKVIDNLLSILNPDKMFKQPTISYDHNQENDDTEPSPIVKNKGNKPKIEIEDMQGYEDVTDSLMDKSSNNVNYVLSTNKKIFKSNNATVSITLHKTNIALSESQVNNIMNMIENKINQKTFKKGIITDTDTGTTVDIEIISKGKPKAPKSPRTPRKK